MPSRQELMTAMRNAHNAGDEDAARRFAGMIASAGDDKPTFLTDNVALPTGQDIADTLKAGGRTALSMAGAIPQGIRGLGEAAFSDVPVSQAWDRAASSNVEQMIPNASPDVSRRQEQIGHALETPIDYAGRGVENAAGGDPLANLGIKGFGIPDLVAKSQGKDNYVDFVREKYGDKAAEAILNSQAAGRTAGEVIANFVPIERGAAMFKGKKEVPNNPTGGLAGKVDATIEARQRADDPVLSGENDFWKQRAEQMTQEARNTPINLPDQMQRNPHPGFPEIDPSLIIRGAEREAPLPQIMDPEIIAAQKAMRGTGDPVLDAAPAAEGAGVRRPGIETSMPRAEEVPPPRMQMPLSDAAKAAITAEQAPRVMRPGEGGPLEVPQVPQTPEVPRVPQWSTEPGAQPNPVVPATEAMATNHTMPTIDFPLKTDVLQGKDPQALFNRLQTLEDKAAKGGKAGAVAAKEAQEVRKLLGDWGWKDWETGKPGFFGFGKETTGKIDHGYKPMGIRKPQEGMTLGLDNSPIVKMLERALKKPEAGQEPTRFEQSVNTKEAVKDLPGSIKDVFNGIDDVPSNPTDLLREHIDSLNPEKDINSKQLTYGKTAESGANLFAKFTNNPFIRGAYKYADEAVKNAGKLKQDLLDPTLKQFNKLDKQEYTDLYYVMRRAEGKFDWTPEQLKDLGLSDKAIEFYQTERAATKKALELENAARELRGQKPIPYRPGYMASTFTGSFRTLIKDAKGETLYVIAENSKRTHDATLAEYKKQAPPDLKYETMDQFNSSTFKNRDSALNYAFGQYMKELVAGDPKAAALQALHEKVKEQLAEAYKGQNQHLKAKKSEAVGGAEGLRFDMTDSENALAGYKAHLQSVENAYLWSEYQKAYSKIGDVLKGTQETLPNVSDYISNYRDQMIGRRSNTLGKLSEVITDAIGKDFAPAYTEKLSSWIKAGLNAKLLGGPTNLSFAALQMLQVVNSLPEMVSVMGRANLKPEAMINALVKGSVDAIHPTTKAMTEALQWAKDNDIIRAAHWDDVGDIGNRKLTQVGKVWNGVIRAADEGSRRLVYMGFVNLLKDNYKGEALYRMAADATERSMTDYRGFESPMMFQSGGVIGRNMMFLHKYPANFMNQLVGFAANKEYAPLMYLLGANFFTAGLTGMIGVQQSDQIINAWNSVMAEHGYKIPSIKEAILRNAATKKDWVAWGPVSAATGMDMSSRASMANLTPDNPVDALMPGMGDAMKVAGAIPGAFNDPKKLLHEAMPSSLKLITEQGLYSKPGANGKTDFTNPNDPQEIKRRRTGFDLAMRAIGAKSLEESKDATVKYIDKTTKAEHAKLRDKVIDNWVRDFNATNNNFERQKITDKAAKLYMQYSGDPTKFSSDLESAVKKSNQTYREQMQERAGKSPQGARQYMEYEGLR